MLELLRKALAIKGNDGTDVFAPVSGEIVALAEVPDPVFASGSVGQGFAVIPADGQFCSPISGKLVMVADDLHAFGIRARNGAEVLVHIGIDTMRLKGEGFRCHATLGKNVVAGQLVISCDLDEMQGKVPSMATPVVLANGSQFSISEPSVGRGNGQPVARIIRQ